MYALFSSALFHCSLTFSSRTHLLALSMSLEQQALERKARLQQKKQKRTTNRNRNYDTELLAAVKGSLRPEVLQSPTAEDFGKKVEEDILGEFDRRAYEALAEPQEEARQKVVHDEHLKKTIEPYTRQAHERTERAIYEIVRRKIAE